MSDALRIDDGEGSFDTRPRWRAIVPAAAPDPLPLVLALHGMGQNLELMQEQVAALAGPDRLLLLAEAPLPFEKRNEEGGREAGHAWYIYTGDQDDFLAWAERAEQYLFRLLEEACRRYRVDRQRIALLGYSQGGYLAGIAALRHPERFGACVIVNARLKHEVAGQPAAAASPPDFLVLHGEKDRFIGIETARASLEQLRARGFRAEFEAFPSGHRFTSEQATRAAAWLAERRL
jgi:phospholipase/carboxylesterase